MKLIRITTIGLTLSVLSFNTVFAATTGVISSNDVNVRLGASTSSSIVKTISRGTSISLDGVSKDFFRNGNTYIASKFITVTNVDATVNSSDVNVRSSASGSSSILGTLQKGSIVVATGKSGDWYQITYNKKTGFVSSKFLTGGFLTYLKSDASSASAAVSQQTYAIVNATGLNLRSSASSSSNSVTSIPNGTILDVKSVSGDWIEVSYDNKNGFVKSSFVSIRTGQKPSRGDTSKGQRVVEYAKQFLGTPYVWGGTNLKKGVDCSGFTYSVYKNFGVSLSRVASAQYNDGSKISKSDLQTGDLVFFDTSGKNKGNICHAGIYAGDGNFIQASSGSQHSVIISPINEGFYKNAYVGACRIIN